MDKELKEKLDRQEDILFEIYKFTKKTEKYIRWTMIGSIVLFVLPAILLMVAIPIFAKTMGDYSDVLNLIM